MIHRKRRKESRERRLRYESLEHRRVLAPVTVSTATDVEDGNTNSISLLISNPGPDGKISLREAIVAANRAQDADTISFSTLPAHGLNNATINLTAAAGGQLSITQSVTIDASMLSSGVTIHAAANSRIFNINGTGTVTLNKLTLSGGHVAGSGGAISTNASLELIDCTVTGNTAIGSNGPKRGGGIYANLAADEFLNIAGSTISQNFAIFDAANSGNSFGGGIYVKLSGDATINISDSSIAENSAAEGAGMAMYLIQNTVAQVQRVTIADNQANNRGGGLFIDYQESGEVGIVDSVITGNDAGLALLGTSGDIPNAGGGIYMYSDHVNILGRPTVPSDPTTKLTITGSEISGNRAGKHGGGITICTKRDGIDATIGEFSVYNSTISGNQAGHTTAALYPGTGGGIHFASKGYGLPLKALDARLQNVTITENAADQGGGIFSLIVDLPNNGTFSDVELSNSIVSANRKHDQSASNLFGTFDAQRTDYNIIGPPGSGNITVDLGSTTPVTIGGIHTSFTDDPMLGELEFRGGINNTRTHVPIAGSIAIDRGSNSLAILPFSDRKSDDTAHAPIVDLIWDQRGAYFRRIRDVPGLGTSTGLIVDMGAVEYHVNPPGDYNRNGIVDAADYTVWRTTLGQSVALPYDGADGDGDGMVDSDDYRVWKTNFGISDGTSGSGSGSLGGWLPPDYNLDGTVDEADYEIWFNTIGETTDLTADGNGNGIIDLADLELWQFHFNVTTLDLIAGDFNVDGVVDTADYDLWCDGDACADADGDGSVAGDMDDYQVWEENFGMVRADVFPLITNSAPGLPLEIPGVAPLVIGVAIGSHDFTGVAGAGEQLRSVAAVNPNSVSIRFSEEVFVTSDALVVTNLDGTSPASVTSFVYDLATQTATWTFNAPLADGRTLLRLSDSVFDLDHEALDGEFFNPISLADTGSMTFPSGDGDAGGEFRFRFTVLAGDTDHNNIHGAANYQNWDSTEPGMIIVSTTADDWDASLAFGDVSLREAVHYANTASQPVAIQLPTGRYVLTRTGTEGSDTAQNDLDVLASMTILGAGAGLSIIDNGGLTAAMTRRAFDVAGSGVALTLDGLTIAHGTAASENGLAVRVGPGASLEVVDSALVHHISLGGGAAIYVDRGDLALRRSVVTNNWNQNQGGAAVYVKALTGAASVLVEDTLFAVNHQYLYGTGNTTKNVEVVGYVTKTNNGGNLYDDATGGFFDTTPGAGDHLGSVDYIVTSVADTMNHADNSEALSIREAVDLANQAAGTQEIWLPAWRFTLTRDRGTNATDTDVSYGDMDIKDSTVIRGVAARTRIAWKSGVVDKVFDLAGDFNYQNEPDYGSVSAADYTLWQNQEGQSGAWEQFLADADDDGDVDADDYAIWSANFGHTLELFDIAV